MTISRGFLTIASVLFITAMMWNSSAVAEEPAKAANCARKGIEVTCDDGRHGIFNGDAIVWPDGTKSSSTPLRSVRIGRNVHIGQGVVAEGKPLDDPNAPAKRSCAILDAVSYCY
ncbi:MAG: hypothetical protein FWD68_14390 [Alphaproteobacteria bacterium]|nr:hypothetical protein [Alphaproteobacteria bacterium]